MVPPFVAAACGDAKAWNRPDNEPEGSEQAALFWGKRTRTLLDSLPMQGARADAASMLRGFLETRPGPDGQSLLERLGPPIRQEGGWFSFAWKPFSYECLPAGKWERAWHGCKLEALYSILYHEKLLESRDRNRGHRLFEGLPGVYVHKDKTARKSEGYMRWIPLCKDGIFWASKWEVRVDREQALDKGKKTDQWVQPESSVRLVSLWLCGLTGAEMEPGSPVAREWNPVTEANPMKLEGQELACEEVVEEC